MPSGRVQSTTSANIFPNTLAGDYAIFTDSSFYLQGAFRVASVDTGTGSFEIELKAGALGRSGHAATVLLDGTILLTGGLIGEGEAITTATAELYDSLTGTSTPVPAMAHARAFHTASLLPSGKVLVAGGVLDIYGDVTATCEVFDPGAGTWSTVTSMGAARAYHQAIVLADGTVLAMGGQTAYAGATADFLATTESYNEGAGTWTAKASMSSRRARFTANLLGSNNIVVAGGYNFGGVLSAAEKYTTGSNSWASAGTLQAARHSLASAVRSDGKVFVTGGSTTIPGTDTPTTYVDLYEEGVGWTVSTVLPIAAQCRHSMVRLTDSGNSILLIGQGIAGGAIRYVSGSWTATPDMLSLDATTGAGRKDAVLAAIGGVAYAVGGLNPLTDKSWTVVEQYDGNANEWTAPHPYLTTGVYPVEKGLAFCRTEAVLQKLVVPLNASYTAATIVPQLSLKGAAASVYRTTAYRVRTNTFNDAAAGDTLAGDIALVAADSSGLLLALAPADATVNLTGHLASVESGNSELGVPSFADLTALGTASDESHLVISHADTLTDIDEADLAGKLVVGSRSPFDALTTFGSVAGFSSAIGSRANAGLYTSDTLALRTSPEYAWMPGSRIWAASAYALASDDTLTVLVDGDVESKRFTLNMWRALAPVGSTYGASNIFKDADNDGVTLATAFGYIDPFDFNDCAVFMAARAKTDTADTTKAILWRYYRLGPDGNSARIRYSYPDAEDSALAITVDNADDANNDIDVVLGSGALRTGYVLSSSYSIGQAATSSSDGLTVVTFILGYKVLSGSRDGSGNVTLLLEMPPGVKHTGWVSGSGPFTFGSASAIPSAAAFTLTGNPTSSGGGIYDTITFNDGSASSIASIANPGVVYLVGGEVASLVGSSAAQHDFIRIETNATTDSRFEGTTMRIKSDPAAHPYYVQMYLGETGSVVTSDTVTQYTLGDATAFKIFENLGQTAGAIVLAANALAADDDRVPVTATLVSDGLGVVNYSSAETALAYPTWKSLTDGFNYVSVTTPAVSSVGDYSLLFKLAIDPDLVLNSDWANEQVRIVPRTAQNVADWLAAPAISGLFTSADASLSSRAHKVQLASVTPGGSGSIQVQGGLANSVSAAVYGTAQQATTSMVVTVSKSDALGMFAGAWCAIDNVTALPKSGIISSGLILQTISLYGTEAQYTVDGSTDCFTTRHAPFLGVQVGIERQGRFVCIYDLDGDTSPIDLAAVSEGDWVRISTGGADGYPGDVLSVNQGIFRVVRVVSRYAGSSTTRDSFWIENPNATEQASTQLDLTFFTPDSMMPGDVLSVSTDLWGAANRGRWTVTTVGAQRFDVAASAVVRASGTATATTTVPHQFAVGDRVSITPGSSVVTESDEYYVSAVGDAYHFSFTCDGVDGTVDTPQSFAGYPFANAHLFQVDNAAETAGAVTSTAAALGTSSPLVQVVEGTVGRFIKQLSSIAPNQTDGSYADLKFNTSERFGHVSAAAGSIVSLLDKLAFSTDIHKGIDGYQHSIGLIGEVNKVIYGDPSDTATYPGVAAAGATVNIQGPLIKRIQVSLSIRVRSGAPVADIEDKVKSSVAAVINQAGIGAPVALSSIMNAASKVTGVVAVAMVNPVLSSANDLITVQAYEKPLVLSLDQDITVSFVGE